MEFFLDRTTPPSLEYRAIIKRNEQPVLVFTDSAPSTAYYATRAELSPLVVFNLMVDSQHVSLATDIESCRAEDLAYLQAYTPGKTRLEKYTEIQARLTAHPLTDKDVKQVKWDNLIYERDPKLFDLSSSARAQKKQEIEQQLRAEGYGLRVFYCLGQIGEQMLIESRSLIQISAHDFKEEALKAGWNDFIAQNPSYGQDTNQPLKPIAQKRLHQP